MKVPKEGISYYKEGFKKGGYMYKHDGVFSMLVSIWIVIFLMLIDWSLNGL